MTTIRFLADWTHVVDGSIERGKPLTIEYAHERAQHKHGGRGGSAPLWSVDAHVKFLPTGELREGPVVTLHPPDPERASFIAGRLDASLYSVPFEISVPPRTTEVQVWFSNHCYQSPTWWDSNYGQNFCFAVSGRRKAGTRRKKATHE